MNQSTLLRQAALGLDGLKCYIQTMREVSQRMKARQKFTTISMVLFMAGCTSASLLEEPFPEPVIDRLPLTIGVFYSEEFRSFHYDEAIPRKGDVAIDAGAANVRMFNRLLPGMFTGVVHLLEPRDTGEGVDAVFIPTIQELQIALPHQTHNDFSEVWIKYHLQLLAPDGETIAAWEMAAYGKSPKGMLESEKEALWEAARVALRDAGAHFAIYFAQKPGVKEWLQQTDTRVLGAPAEASEAAHET